MAYSRTTTLPHLDPVAASGDNVSDGHLVAGDGTRLVAADHVDTAQGLHRRQLLHDRLLRDGTNLLSEYCISYRIENIFKNQVTH